MYTLYYCPGVCSLASHITLEEIGAEYKPMPVLLPKLEQLTEAYRKINPRAKVPALVLDDGTILIENASIMAFLARRHADAKLMPQGEIDQARWLSLMTWFSNTVHPSFTRIFRTDRFSENKDALPGIKEAGKKDAFAALSEVDAMLAKGPWIMGEQFTTCDPYATVFYTWGTRAELPMAELKNYTAWKDRMLQRPAVRKILEREESPLLKAA
jgi:glutathione S-transferase